MQQPEMYTRIGALVYKYLTNEITVEEQQELEQFISESEDHEQLFAELTNPTYLIDGIKRTRKWDVEASLQRIKKDSPAKPIRFRKITQVAAAAVIFLAALIGGLIHIKKNNKRTQVAMVNNPISFFRALLIEENGDSIRLDESKNGKLATGSIELMKNDSQLLYPATPVRQITIKPVIHLVETLKGSFYQILLPDGSKVWLNTTSSIMFPTSFSEGERNVSINGEAYFEVVKNQSKPFTVQVEDMKIQVTGTKFNIKAYKEDNTVQATLLEGGIKVSTRKDTAYLTPGEQAVFTKEKKLKKIKDKIAVIKAMAWKQKNFHFEQDDLKTIMTELARWYDYKVEYTKEVPATTYTAVFFRSVPLREILDYFTVLTKYKFTIDEKEKTIIVQL